MEQRREDPDRGGLPGAIRTEEAEHGARLDLEVDASKRLDLPEALHETLGDDGCPVHEGGILPALSSCAPPQASIVE
jgi:hypothetical protein